ncbi:MAG: hypothetical protein U0236_07720 [Nitrospira sp.]
MQPLTAWWSQQLTLSRATETLGSDGGAVERSLVTVSHGTHRIPAGPALKQRSNRIEWQHNIRVGKPLLRIRVIVFESRGATIVTS